MRADGSGSGPSCREDRQHGAGERPGEHAHPTLTPPWCGQYRLRLRHFALADPQSADLQLLDLEPLEGGAADLEPADAESADRKAADRGRTDGERTDRGGSTGMHARGRCGPHLGPEEGNAESLEHRPNRSAASLGHR